MTVNSLNGLSTHLIKSVMRPIASVLGASGFGAEVGAATDTLIVCSALGLGVLRLTGATLAGVFFAVTMFKPIYQWRV
jgi:hypothetical protein